MSTLEEDLTQLNFEYLMLARECARSNPMEAAWRFGLDPDRISEFAALSMEEIKNQSSINRAVITLLPIGQFEASTTAYAALLIHTDQSQNKDAVYE
ncbi:hypothetical protein [Methylomonas sp. AM2-LC]|uniref:hypothetical protein n=1 Tax=Methylomonas sp. AM2-LC TaxID=3153301 RepID=UPI003267BD14